MLLASLIFVELVELYNLNGERPTTIFRDGCRSCAATCQVVREDVAIIDTCMVSFCSIALFFAACPRVVTPDSNRCCW